MRKVVKSWIHLLMKWVLAKWIPAPVAFPSSHKHLSCLIHQWIYQLGFGNAVQTRAKCVAKWNCKPCKRCGIVWPWGKWVRKRLDSHMKPFTNEDLGSGEWGRPLATGPGTWKEPFEYQVIKRGPWEKWWGSWNMGKNPLYGLCEGEAWSEGCRSKFVGKTTDNSLLDYFND